MLLQCRTIGESDADFLAFRDFKDTRSLVSRRRPRRLAVQEFYH
jgi:hypothetical protein